MNHMKVISGFSNRKLVTVKAVLAHTCQKLSSEKEMIQRHIDATDVEINKLVYELYGLTEDEIAIVKG